jgi:hypothetical protein
MKNIYKQATKEIMEQTDADVLKEIDKVIKDSYTEDLKRQIEQLQTQLAGCGVAALGGTSEAQVANKGDYGWSAAYQDVLNLRMCYDQISAAIQKYQYIGLITGINNEKENSKTNK